MAEKGSPYYRKFPESQQCNIHPTDNDSHANAGLQNSDVICYYPSGNAKPMPYFEVND